LTDRGGCVQSYRASLPAPWPELSF
jgi:hypothetical protein